MSPQEHTEAMIANINDWRSERLVQLKKLIETTDPELTLDWKWSVPVWLKNGLVCAINSFKNHVKINFFHGASLNDPNGIFNSGLDSKVHRSINFAEHDEINEPAIRALLKAAIDYNQRKGA
ncbi:MAG: DUF1801 domain-containing protein [bacterium]|nr:DUF1801 domain-containing protein [bacterium]